MSIYSRIFTTTSKRFTSAVISGQKVPPQALWAFPGFVAFTWFIWGALTDDIKQSVGLYYDPDAVLKRVEAERAQRLEAREALKAAAKPKKDDAGDDDDDDDDEAEDDEEVTAKDIEDAVNKAVAAAADDDDDDDEDNEDYEEKKDNAEAGGDDEEEEEDDEEEDEKPKKPKVDFDKLTKEEKWEYFAEKSVTPGDDDEEEEDEDDDDDDE